MVGIINMVVLYVNVWMKITAAKPKEWQERQSAQ